MPRLNYAAVALAFSVPRMAGYYPAPNQHRLALENYKNNIKLSEALYPSIQKLEVVFRNQLETVLILGYGQHWFQSAQFLQILDSYGRNKLNTTIRNLQKLTKNITSGAVVAEMTFGFWTSLVSKPYDQTIWRKYQQNLFPHATATQRDVKQIRQDLDTIRKLRNRIAHHEPIWQDKNLLLKHQSILQLLGWMNPHVTLWLQRTKLDHFVVVHKSVYHPTHRKPRVKK
jgi:hypothetical protein